MDHSDTNPWLDQLQHADLRSLGSVLTELRQLLDSDHFSAPRLAQLINRDAALTARVLRVANSGALYGQGHYDSIEQAVVRIGTEGIRALAISSLLVEALTRRPPQYQQLLRVLAQSFHSAVQARNIARQLKMPQENAIFTAALLQRIGELAFWSSKLPALPRFRDALKANPEQAEQLFENVTGLSHHDIGATLSEQWHLGELVQQSFDHRHPASPEVAVVQTGYRISEALRQGWFSNDSKREIRAVAELLGHSPAEALKLLRHGANEAITIAQAYSPQIASQLAPAPSEAEVAAARARKAKTENSRSTAQNQSAATHVGPADTIVATQRQNQEARAADEEGHETPTAALSAQDKAVMQQQMELLDQLWLLVDQHADHQALLQHLLDGIHRGIGLARVFIALPERNRLVRVKLFRGEGMAAMAGDLEFSVLRRDHNILAHCWHELEPLHVSPLVSPRLMRLIDQKLRHHNGNCTDFLLAPILCAGKPIALVYADQADQQPITEAQFDAFKRFTRQASKALTVTAHQGAESSSR